MLRYRVAFHFPCATGEMVVVETLDFPGSCTQGFDLPDARLMIASAGGTRSVCNQLRHTILYCSPKTFPLRSFPIAAMNIANANTTVAVNAIADA